MIRINLLPHREEKRKAKRQQFFGLSGLISLLACLIVFLVYTIIGGYIEAQEGKNNFLKTEIAALDKEIDEIKKLQEKTQALLACKQIIESLQHDRAEAVHLLNELVRQVPEGIYLRSVKQEGPKVTLVGYAQSNARVSTLMRNAEASPWLEKPVLIETKLTDSKSDKGAASDKRRRLNEFTMTLNLKRPEMDKKDGGKKK